MATTFNGETCFSYRGQGGSFRTIGLRNQYYPENDDRNPATIPDDITRISLCAHLQKKSENV